MDVIRPASPPTRSEGWRILSEPLPLLTFFRLGGMGVLLEEAGEQSHITGVSMHSEHQPERPRRRHTKRITVGPVPLGRRAWLGPPVHGSTATVAVGRRSRTGPAHS